MFSSKILKAAGLIMLALVAQISFAQNKVISGKVTDSKDGSAVQGATVSVKGSNVATQTNADGTFKLNVPDNATALVFSSVGFERQEVSITGQNFVNVSLVNSNTGLGEVVVVAYGTRRKTDLTNAVTQVGTKDFQKGNIASSEQLLQGKVAGLEVTTGGGSAGGGSKIRIRGSASLNASNDPLIVIDGVPVEGNGMAGANNLLNTINPNDIESMSVLKDAAAAALYGARATNGVIIITTKKGTSKKPAINFNTKLSVFNPHNRVKVLSADQVREIVNANGNATYRSLLGTENTDWQDQIYQNAIGLDNNLSISGRQDISKGFSLPYRLSLGYLSQEGILKTNKFDRFSLSFNLSPKFFKDHLSLNINGKYANTKTRFADEGAIGTAVGFDPTQPVYNKNSNKYGGFWEWELGGSPLGLAPRNPVGLLELQNNKSTLNRFIGNIQADYKLHFFPDLHVLVNLGMDNAVTDGLYVRDSISVLSVLGDQSKGRYSQYGGKKYSKLADVQLFYQKDLGRGNKVDVLVGHGYQEYMTDTKNYLTYFQDGVTEQPGQILDFPLITDGFAIESYIGRANLTLANKYLFQASVRRDASSKFAEANRNAIFPAVSFAWKLNEDLFKNVRAINELKLRLGWGETGQQDGISNSYYAPLYYLAGAGAQFNFGNTFTQPYRPTAYNPDLQWETTQTLNLGLDYVLLANRISGAIDVYQKKTKDLISSIDVAPGSNFDVTMTYNIGSLVNKGVEFSINTVPVKNKNLTWDLGFNVTYNKAEITSLYNSDAPGYKGIQVGGISGGTGNNIMIHAVGYAPFTFYPNQQVYTSDGKPIEGLFNDKDRNGIVDDADREYYKKPNADIMFGFSTGITYKKFSAGITGHGMVGNYLYNNFNSNNSVLRNILNPVRYIGNAGVNYLDTRFTNNRYLSDYYIENASFFRLDNINLGYDLGRIINNKARLRLNANIQNIFVITKYSGADPENTGGIDNNIYPRPRIFTIGANLDF
jgi:TonB-dependent starch-binding outer membrane protein SusC